MFTLSSFRNSPIYNSKWFKTSPDDTFDYQLNGKPFLHINFHVKGNQISLEYFNAETGAYLSNITHFANAREAESQESIKQYISFKKQKIKEALDALQREGFSLNQLREEGRLFNLMEEMINAFENRTRPVFFPFPKREFPIHYLEAAGRSSLIATVIVEGTKVYALIYDLVYANGPRRVENLCTLKNHNEDVSSIVNEFAAGLKKCFVQLNELGLVEPDLKKEIFNQLLSEHMAQKREFDEKVEREGRIIANYLTSISTHKKINYFLEKTLFGELADERAARTWEQDILSGAGCATVEPEEIDYFFNFDIPDGISAPWTAVKICENGVRIVDVEIPWQTSINRLMVRQKYCRDPRPSPEEIMDSFVKTRRMRAQAIEFIINQPSVREYKLYHNKTLVAFKYNNRFEIIHPNLFYDMLKVPTKKDIETQFCCTCMTPEYIEQAIERNDVPPAFKPKLIELTRKTFLRCIDAISSWPFNLDTEARREDFLRRLYFLKPEMRNLYLELRLCLEKHPKLLKEFNQTHLTHEYFENVLSRKAIPAELRPKLELLYKRTLMKYMAELLLNPFDSQQPKEKFLEDKKDLDQETRVLYFDIRFLLEKYPDTLDDFRSVPFTREYVETTLKVEEAPEDLKPLLRRLLQMAEVTLMDAEKYSPSNGNLGHSRELFYREIEGLDSGTRSLYFDIRDMLSEYETKRRGGEYRHIVRFNTDEKSRNVMEYMCGKYSIHQLNITPENARRFLEIAKLFDFALAQLNLTLTNKIELPHSGNDLRNYVMRIDPTITSTEAHLKTVQKDKIGSEEHRFKSVHWTAGRVGVHANVLAKNFIEIREASKDLKDIKATRGNSGTGKSTWLEWMHVDKTMNVDDFKFDLRKAFEVLNKQIHVEGDALMYGLVDAISNHLYRLNFMNYVLDSRLWAIEFLDNYVLTPAKKREGAGVVLRDFEVPLKTSLNRILTRQADGKDPCPTLEAIVLGFKQLRETRKKFIERILEEKIVTEYVLLYRGKEVARKTEKGLKIVDKENYNECLRVLEENEIDGIQKQIITPEYITKAIADGDIRESQRGMLETWLGYTLGEAVSKHAERKKSQAADLSILPKSIDKCQFPREGKALLFVNTVLENGKLTAYYYNKEAGDLLFEEVISDRIGNEQELQLIIREHKAAVEESLNELEEDAKRQIEKGSFKHIHLSNQKERKRKAKRKAFVEKAVHDLKPIPEVKTLFVYNFCYLDDDDKEYLRETMIVQGKRVMTKYFYEGKDVPFFEEEICTLEDNPNHFIVYGKHTEDIADTMNALKKPGLTEKQIVESGQFTLERKRRQLEKINQASQILKDSTVKFCFTVSSVAKNNQGKHVLFIQLTFSNNEVTARYYDRQGGMLLFEEPVMTMAQVHEYFKNNGYPIVDIREDLEKIFDLHMPVVLQACNSIDDSKEPMAELIKKGAFKQARLGLLPKVQAPPPKLSFSLNVGGVPISVTTEEYNQTFHDEQGNEAFSVKFNNEGGALMASFIMNDGKTVFYQENLGPYGQDSSQKVVIAIKKVKSTLTYLKEIEVPLAFALQEGVFVDSYNNQT